MDMSHVIRFRLPHVPAFRIACHWLVYSYVSIPVLRVPLYLTLVPLWIVDSSPGTCLFSVSPFVLLTHLLTFLLCVISPFVLTSCLCLPLLLMPFPFVVRQLVSRLAILGL